MKWTSLTLTIYLVVAAFVTGCSTRKIDTNHTYVHHEQAFIDDFSTYASPQNRLGNNNTTIAVATAISGGGHRASNFGVGALIGLQNISLPSESNALMEIDYFSTVSGGGFAAGSFISTYHDYLQQGKTLEEKKLLSVNFDYQNFYDTHLPKIAEEEKCRKVEAKAKPICVKRNVNRGYHSPLFKALLKPKIWFTNLDRGDYLEQKINCRLLASCWREGNPLVLGDVYRLKDKTPYLPMWATNSTIYENGSIFPFTPSIAEEYKVNGYTHNLRKYCIGEKEKAINEWDCDNRWSESVYDIPLSVGVKASASFPAAVAATTLKSNPEEGNNNFIHLLDGGVSDNLGVNTAIHMLNSTDPKGQKVLENPEGQEVLERKVLIVIDAFNSNGNPHSHSEGSPSIPQLLSHLKDMPLTSWRGRYRQTIERIVDDHTDIIYLNFDGIYSNSKLPNGCTKLQDGSVLTVDMIFKMAKKVGTSFNVTDDQQIALVCAGKIAVAEQAKKIGQLLNPSIDKYCEYSNALRSAAGRNHNPICESQE